jgi:hypothetical protein
VVGSRSRQPLFLCLRAKVKMQHLLLLCLVILIFAGEELLLDVVLNWKWFQTLGKRKKQFE